MIKNIVKGMIIGLANIIPGVSGGTLAISMGIYDKIIHCISHFFSDIKNNILFALPILAGMGIAIAASAFGIDYLFEQFPVQTNLLFIGLIVGSLPAIYGKVKSVTIRKGHLLSALVFFAVVVGLAFLNDSTGKDVVLAFTFWEVIKLFFVGIIASATMVIPGVSGSMMLLLMGYYNPILDAIQEFIMALTSGSIVEMWNKALILIPFGLGVVIGMIGIAKLIEIILAKFPAHAYFGIIGLVVASPIAILMVAELPALNIVNILTGLIACGAGFLIANKLGEK